MRWTLERGKDVRGLSSCITIPRTWRLRLTRSSEQPRRPRQGGRSLETFDFGARDPPSERRQTVVPPPLVLAVGIGPLHFRNQPIVEQAFQDCVECSRPKSLGTVRAFGDILDDRVAVAIRVTERHHHVKDGRRERQVSGQIVLCGSHRSISALRFWPQL